MGCQIPKLSCIRHSSLTQYSYYSVPTYSIPTQSVSHLFGWEADNASHPNIDADTRKQQTHNFKTLRNFKLKSRSMHERSRHNLNGEKNERRNVANSLFHAFSRSVHKNISQCFFNIACVANKPLSCPGAQERSNKHIGSKQIRTIVRRFSFPTSASHLRKGDSKRLGALVQFKEVRAVASREKMHLGCERDLL